ncbi:MAG: apolipoprotein N-acyltransferase [Lentisphaerae bacterium]|nr:apolipoprotein N-acyltransferase [Lentisphaerota bacterium]
MIRKILRILPKFLWLLPGFLAWAAFPPMGEKTDILFAFAPLLWLARRGDAKRSALTWFNNGLLFWVGTLAWMPAIVKNGGPWPLVVLGWGALAAYCALYFAAFGWLDAHVWRWVAGERLEQGRGVWRAYSRRLAAILVFEPILWAGLELVRSRLFGGFAWNQLGVAMVNAGFGAPARLGGVYLVSALVILVNGTIASIAERMLEPFLARRRLPDGHLEGPSPVPSWVRSCETLVPLAVVWGVFRLSASFAPEMWRAEQGPSVNFALVQRNFPCVFKAGDGNPIEKYTELLAHVGLLRPDVVVLPESALCEFGDVRSQRAKLFADWVCETTGATYVMSGGGSTVAEEGGSVRLYNSVGVYDGAEKVRDVYDKVHLVPFGEYIPFDKTFTVLQKLAPVGSCTAGELKTVSVGPFADGRPEVSLGVAICFEDTDSAQMRELARKGAQALVFVTNDSWFSKSDEAVQHAWQSVARAVETGLPVVRVGNSGVTGTIAPDGAASWLSADGRPIVDKSASMFDRVELAPKPSADADAGQPARRFTPYVVLGDKPIFCAFLLLIAALILIKYLSYHEKRRTLSM